MRLAIMVAALGFVMGAPVMAPASLMNEAEAQSVQEQQAIQAQLIALAQAGDWAGFEAIVNAQVAAGNSAMLATIAGNISSMGLAVADTDGSSAIALTLAAMSLVDNASVYSANPSQASQIGNNAGQVKARIVRRNPAGAAAIASAAARNNAPGLVVAYNSGQSMDQDTGSTNTPVVIGRRGPPMPSEPVLPVPIEPNPQQTGSPT